MPSPPTVKALRVRVTYTDVDGLLAGSRFFLSYAGSAPSSADCTTLATDIATAWSVHMSGVVGSDWTLTEVDVLDLASALGASSETPVSEPGGLAGPHLPSNVCYNIEYDIARRYRGGKPRMYLPGPNQASLADNSHFTGAVLTAVNAAMAGWFTAIEALSVGAVGALAHVNISFYAGYDVSLPIVKPSGTRYPPKYRAAAQVDAIEGYATKSVVGSQRRRRTSTTP